MESTDDYEISTDRGRMDVELIHAFLRESSYWAQGVSRSIVEKSLEHSLCLGAFLKGRQVAFARVITDYATFAYLADVFVLKEHRGREISKRLMRAVLSHPELQGLRRFLPATKDAHGLYAQFGFKPLANPVDFMTIHHPDIYRAA